MAVIKQLNHKSQVKQSTQADLQYPPLVGNRALAFYDAIVGSSSQLNSGAATHTSIQSAVNSVGVNGNILILKGTYTESVSLNNAVKIEGQGHGSVLSGSLTVSASYCDLSSWRVVGNISESGNNNFLKLWQASGTFSDTGAANDNHISQE